MLHPRERRLLLVLAAWLALGTAFDLAARARPRLAARLVGVARLDDVRAAGVEEPDAASAPALAQDSVRAGGRVVRASEGRPTRRRARRAFVYDASGRLDLARADSTELTLLEGVGPALASRILAERRRRGGFARAGDLLGVRGIGPKTLAKLLPQVTVGAAKDSLSRAAP